VKSRESHVNPALTSPLSSGMIQHHQPKPIKWFVAALRSTFTFLLAPAICSPASRESSRFTFLNRVQIEHVGCASELECHVLRIFAIFAALPEASITQPAVTVRRSPSSDL
jgi:hypothetical protein